MSTELIPTDNADIAEKMFLLEQRHAKALMSSTLLPKEYQNNLGNVLVALGMARRIGADPVQVMQSLYVVHGKPSWSAAFLIACFNSCGKFTSMQFEFSGTGDDYGCTAYATEKATGKEIRGTKITWKMVKAEGWDSKQGSKWRTMPDQMFVYRAASFFVRTAAPELSLGFQTQEEVYDTVDAVEVKRVSQKHAEPIEVPAEVEPVA